MATFGKFNGLPNQLIQRIAALAPKLRPELLHRVIDAYGLEDCVDLVAQATPAQLSYVFDLDLWRPTQPGHDERFDPERFGVWVEVLAEAGSEIAAAKLAEMPLPQIVSALAHHVDVYDVAAVSSYETSDGDIWDYSAPVRDRIGAEIAGYHVAARREDAWDAIVAVLVALDQHHPDRFVALMRAVRARSHSRRERDGFHDLLDNRDQMMFDAAEERERRRKALGFASPGDARAFLSMARAITPDTPLQPNPLTADYARSIEPAVDQPDAPDASPEEEVQIAELLAEAGVTPLHAPRALLGGATTEATTAMQRCMQAAYERDPVAHSERTFELAFLANVLVSGCPLQGRPFTAKEAADAAVAICNLGLERVSPLPDEYFFTHDAIRAFQLGWSTLYHDVCLATARALVDVLSGRLTHDDEVQSALNLLQARVARALEAGTPWQAADTLEVLTSIDMPAWAALVGLIAECPVLHAGLAASIDSRARSFDPHAFGFIAENRHLDAVRAFLTSLPRVLRG